MLHWTVLQMVLQTVKTELNTNSQLKVCYFDFPPSPLESIFVRLFNTYSFQHCAAYK
jgi:hypothetical protein